MIQAIPGIDCLREEAGREVALLREFVQRDEGVRGHEFGLVWIRLEE